MESCGWNRQFDEGLLIDRNKSATTICSVYGFGSTTGQNVQAVVGE
jgi:hypothetical protein